MPFLGVEMVKMAMKVKVNDPRFQDHLRVFQDVKLVIPALICDELSSGQTEFLRILSQNDQIYLEGQWTPFSIVAESIRDACLVQIQWFQLKSVTLSCRQRKITEGQTNRQTGNNNTPVGLKGQRVKWEL